MSKFVPVSQNTERNDTTHASGPARCLDRSSWSAHPLPETNLRRYKHRVVGRDPQSAKNKNLYTGRTRSSQTSSRQIEK